MISVPVSQYYAEQHYRHIDLYTIFDTVNRIPFTPEMFKSFTGWLMTLVYQWFFLHDKRYNHCSCYNTLQKSGIAGIAQQVEHVIRNDGVAGSNPVSGTTSLDNDTHRKYKISC